MLNKRKILCILLFILFAITPLSFPQEFESLYKLYKQKDFFVFREKIKGFSNNQLVWQEIFLKAINDNVFGKSVESNNHIEILLDIYKNYYPDSILSVIYETKILNHINLFEYKKAYETALLLNSANLPNLEPEEKSKLDNELRIWEMLQIVPPQIISKKGSTIIEIKKDAVGLWRLPVKTKNFKYYFLFDTGANFCVIMESVAKKLGFEIIDNSKIEVGTSTDKKINSKIAISKHLEFGNVKIENAVFIVLPDESLNFGEYKIEGIIGNPILKSLGNILISNNNELSLPERNEKSELKNIAFDGFNPVIQMTYKKDLLNFIFDTGGQETYLYNSFFEKYKNIIKGNSYPTKIKIGGAGGSTEVNGYIIDRLVLSSGMSNTELKKVKLITDKLQDLDNYYYGNLGQDFFNSFRKIRINYTEMYIEFIK